MGEADVLRVFREHPKKWLTPREVYNYSLNNGPGRTLVAIRQTLNQLAKHKVLERMIAYSHERGGHKGYFFRRVKP